MLREDRALRAPPGNRRIALGVIRLATAALSGGNSIVFALRSHDRNPLYSTHRGGISRSNVSGLPAQGVLTLDGRETEIAHCMLPGHEYRDGQQWRLHGPDSLRCRRSASVYFLPISTLGGPKARLDDSQFNGYFAALGISLMLTSYAGNDEVQLRFRE